MYILNRHFSYFTDAKAPVRQLRHRPIPAACLWCPGFRSEGSPPTLRILERQCGVRVHILFHPLMLRDLGQALVLAVKWEWTEPARRVVE